MEESHSTDCGIAPHHDDSVSSPSWKPRHKVLVGVIGGIGPAASAHLYQTIVQLRTAVTDDDHIPLLIYNNPQIPNNNAAARGLGPSSVPAMVYTARALQRAGATHVVLPCNTAHVFADALQQELRRLEAGEEDDGHASLQFIHMLELTASRVMEALRRRDSLDENYNRQEQCYRVGLMGTIGTVQSKIYHKVLEKAASAASQNGTIERWKMDALPYTYTYYILTRSPSLCYRTRLRNSWILACIGPHTCSIQVISPADPNIVQDCIGRIKAGDREDVLPPLLEQFQALSEVVDAIVLGCTELPLVLTPAQRRCSCGGSVPVLDPLLLLAEEIIRLTAESEEKGAATDCGS